MRLSCLDSHGASNFCYLVTSKESNVQVLLKYRMTKRMYFVLFLLTCKYENINVKDDININETDIPEVPGKDISFSNEIKSFFSQVAFCFWYVTLANLQIMIK